MSVVREINLHKHQQAAVDRLRDLFSTVSRIVLVAPTAFGKTECAASVLMKAIEKNVIVWFIVDRIPLIWQVSARLDLYGIDHGIIQGDNPRRAPEKLVQIVSAQTLGRRDFPSSQLPKLIIWDECHCFNKDVFALIEQCPRARVIGLTATPFTPGMADYWDAIVNGATTNYLLGGNPEKKRFLAPLKVKACVEPDMAGARRKSDGEYEEEDAGRRGIVIIGDVLQTWERETRRHFGGPVKTIVFAPSVAYGEEFCRQAADAGFNFQQISYLDKDAKSRQAKLDEFAKPDSAIHGLVSCAVLTKGFDVPDVMCGISCRPYVNSFSSHIQELGRVMRIAPGKDFGLWLCHSGNAVKFAGETASLYEFGVESLSDGERKNKEPAEPKERVKARLFCNECGTQMEAGNDACLDCGWQRPKRGEIQTVQGELIDIDISMKDAFRPRARLHAACLSDPRRVWAAALAYCAANSRKGDAAARKWAFGVWSGIYPTSKLPRGLYDRPIASDTTPDEWQLIEREVQRFRKKAPAPCPRAA